MPLTGHRQPTSDAAARAGLWLLPIYGLLLAYSTRTQQPDQHEQFEAYARYVTTLEFLLSHLIASIGGAALAILGVVSAVTFLSRGAGHRPAVTGLVLTVLSQVLMTSVFGSAAFVQPGIGRAFLAGRSGMPDLNEDTAYGTATLGTAGVSILLLIAGAALLGVAIARTAPELRWVGIGFGAGLPLFAINGFLTVGFPTQPLFGLLLSGITVVLARRLPTLAPARERPLVSVSGA